MAALVQSGGVTFDSQGFAITVAQPLLHDPALGGNDGGLTKLGSGTLTLAGSSIYNGNTFVNAGILNVRNSAALGTMANGVNVNNLATLQLEGSCASGRKPVAGRCRPQWQRRPGKCFGLELLDGVHPTQLDHRRHTRIDSDADSRLRFRQNPNGSVNGATGLLAVGGAGTVTISGVGIAASVNGLTKDTTAP